MAIWTVDYAYLSAMAYRRWEVGQETDAADSPSGYRYRVIDYLSDPSGYYGVIFQNTTTLEYVVAHCGTEASGEYQDIVRDLLMTDGQMSLFNVNQQKGAALWLAERALTLAAESGNVPSVTVTGHSLGGALAQITAARFGLFGETFNAYGAAAQIEDVHADARIINHSRVSDIVGTAALHFGELRLYATEGDADLMTPPMGDSYDPISAMNTALAIATFDVHTIEQFYPGGDAVDVEFLLTDEHRQRFAENSAWYGLHIAAIRYLAGMINTAARGWMEFMEATGMERQLAPLMSFLRDASDVHNDRIFIGTSENDVRTGSGASDYMTGYLGEDRLSGGEGKDWLYGGADNDVLRGGDHDDHLDGGDDDDYLEGGTGNDTLLGGTGNDRYEFSIADFQSDPGSRDVIRDSDGVGYITIDSVQFAAGQRIGSDTWLSADEAFRIDRVSSDGGTSLVIRHFATRSSIVVEGWTEGSLGIALGGAAPEAPVGTNLTGGDDLFGETGSNTGNNVITALACNDGLDGGNGEDTLDGGVGNDLILGGAGNDHLYGGDGDDHIFDGSERANLREWTSTERDQADYDIQNNLGAGTLLARGESWYVVQGGPLDGVHAPQWIYQDPDLHPGGDDFIDAGAGNDRVFAGEGNDIVLGGSGDDYLNGGHDDDTIHGGEGNDIIEGDVTADSLPGVHLTRAVSAAARINGDDVLDGGAGDDIIRGGGGNDIIYGGDGRLPNGAPNFGSRSFPRRRKSLFLVEGKSDFHLCRNGERCRHRRNNRRFVFLPLLYDEAAAGQREMGRRFIDAII